MYNLTQQIVFTPNIFLRSKIVNVLHDYFSRSYSKNFDNSKIVFMFHDKLLIDVL